MTDRVFGPFAPSDAPYEPAGFMIQLGSYSDFIRRMTSMPAGSPAQTSIARLTSTGQRWTTAFLWSETRCGDAFDRFDDGSSIDGFRTLAEPAALEHAESRMRDDSGIE